MSWVVIQAQNAKLKDYVLMQGIKGSSTLRVGPKGEKPFPRIIYRYGKQDEEIHNFIKNRKEIKDLIKIMTPENHR